MLQLLQMVERYEPVAADPGPASEPVGGRARDGPREGGEVEIGAGPERLRLRQRAAARTRSSSSRSRSTARRSPTRRSRDSSRRPARSRRSTGSATAHGGWVRTAMGETRAARSRATRSSTSTTRRDRVRRVGRQAAADRVRVGGGRARAPTASRANLDHLAFGTRAGRRLRRRRRRVRRRADARRRVGVDSLRLQRLSRASRRSPTTSTRRSSSAPSTRCFAAARGPRDAT